MMIFLLKNWRMMILGFSIFSISVMMIGFWMHHKGLERETNALKAENSIKDLVIQEQQKTLSEWVKSQKEIKETLIQFRENQIHAREETKRLAKIFSSHDFDVLVQKDPSSVERVINTGTDRILRLLECASGSTYPDCPSKDPGTAEARAN